MDTLTRIALNIKAAIRNVLGNTKAAPPAPRTKLNGRRGYGDNDISPPGA